MDLPVIQEDKLHDDNAIRRHHDFLVDRMSSEFGLIDKLYTKGTLNNLQKNEIEAEAVSQNKNKILLKHIDQKITCTELFEKDACEKLFEALKECGQSHLVKYMEADGVYKPDFGGNWPLTENVTLELKTIYETLIDILDSRDLVGRLFQTDLLNSKQVNLIKSKGTSEEQNRILLEFLRIGSFKFYGQIIQSLHEYNQKHIANIIESGGVYRPNFGGNWPLTESEKTVLLSNYETLVDLLDSQDLVGLLFQTGVLNKRQRNLVSSKATTEEQNKVLLDILRKGSLDGYWQTIRCLHASNQSHVAKIFEYKGVVVRIDANLQTDSPNLTEIENSIVAEVTNMLRHPSVSDASRLLEKVKLNLVAVAARHSVSLYFLCTNLGDIGLLEKMALDGHLEIFVEDIFNLLMTFPARIKVILKWSRDLFSKSRKCIEGY